MKMKGGTSDGSVGSSGGSAALPSCPSPRIKMLLPVRRALIGLINRELRWEPGMGREGVSGCWEEGI